jgi:hypothetical protein
MPSYLTEPRRQTPIAHETDVLVVGGGPAGIAAALAAARSGARTFLVEQFNSLGGVGGPGLHNHISQVNAHGSPLRVVGGLAWELGLRIRDAGVGDLGSCYDVDPEGYKFLLDEWLAEAGVRVLYHTFVADAWVEAGVLRGVVVQNKSGRQAIAAGQVIDCTGDGDVGCLAGAPWEQGRDGDGRCQPVTMMFRMGGVDWAQVCAWRKDYQCIPFFEELQARGEMEPFQNQIMGFWHNSVRPDQVGINFTHVIAIDSTKAEELTAATIEGRRQVQHCVQVFRQHIPGFQDGYLIDTAATIGLRESRRLLGDYVLTFEDITARREFADSIGYGSFFVDIHNLDGPGMSPSTLRPEPGFRYQMPYRILVPREVENLLAAGRCVSVTHRALGSVRVMLTCMVLGEAAGVAAAQALAAGVAPRAVDVGRLRTELRARGVLLDEDDLARANA